MDVEDGFSIIIPTFNEVDNIPILAERIAATHFNQRPFEVILVDDNSQDGSAMLVEKLRTQYPWLSMLERKKKPDLSRSILDGMQAAKYPVCITMDADLSHPPQKIIEMLTTLAEPGVDAVFGSRYMPAGSIDESWSFLRKSISRGSALLARILLPFPMTDPLSGFMAIRKQTVFSGAALEPIGWKIGLEILIKCRCQCVKEIPIHFSNRYIGYSKLTLKIGLQYLQHVAALTYFKLFKRSFS